MKNLLNNKNFLVSKGCMSKSLILEGGIKMKRFLFFLMILMIIFSIITSVGFSQKQDLIIVSGSTGGVYYLWGAALAKMITDLIPDVTASVGATGGSTDNPILLTENEADIAFFNVQIAYEGYTGTGHWTGGRELKNLRYIALLYPSFFTAVTLEDSDIDTIYDFEGKSIGVGPAMGTPDVVTTEMVKILEIQPKKLVRSGQQEIANLMRDGLIDAYTSISGQPVPCTTDLEVTHSCKLIELSDDVIQKFRENYSYWAPGVIPKETYKSLDNDYKTLQWFNGLAVDERMSDELAYQIVKTIFDHKDIIEDTHPSTAKYLKMENIVNASIPVHPGAIKFYEENGIDIPESLVP